DRHQSTFYAKIWREAAATLGATITPLGGDVFEICLGEARTRVSQNMTSIDDMATSCVARTKPVIYGLLNQHGISTPRYRVFPIEDMAAGVAFLESIQGDCVVKPASGTGGGIGVTTGVRTRWQFARAAFAAAAHGDEVLIEEQAKGDDYRLLYLDGVLIDAVMRKPPTVTADGRASLLDLIRGANAERASRGAEVAQRLLTFDMDMKNTLAKQGYTLASVPPAGREVKVKTAINENVGDGNISARDLICEAVAAEGARASALAGVRLAGVDVIMSNQRVPLQDSGGVILEVNPPPGYYWHYHKRDGVFPVALHVLRSLLHVPQSDEMCCLPSSAN